MTSFVLHLGLKITLLTIFLEFKLTLPPFLSWAGCQVIKQQKVTSSWDINVQPSLRYERHTTW